MHGICNFGQKSCLIPIKGKLFKRFILQGKDLIDLWGQTLSPSFLAKPHSWAIALRLTMFPIKFTVTLPGASQAIPWPEFWLPSSSYVLASLQCTKGRRRCGWRSKNMISFRNRGRQVLVRASQPTDWQGSAYSAIWKDI